MRAATIIVKGKEMPAAVTEDGYVVDIKKAARQSRADYRVPDSMIEAAADGQTFWEESRKLMEWVQENNRSECMYFMEEVFFTAPIPVPEKNIMCAGKNYKDHAVEMGSAADIPEDPIIFTKAPSTVIGPEEAIKLHDDVTSEVDYEGEFAVIIGRKGSRISKEEAGRFIFGYTLINDVTARDLQARHKQFFLGKSLDTFCPMGPFVLDARKAEGKDLRIETYVNGERRQQGTMSQMIFSPSDLIEIISRAMTLYPGDIIATGTPSGVGKSFRPPRLLGAGDEVIVKADELGELRNNVQQ
ncbi:fumarylacetoacetate hydrolase family protein [Salibacterium sp. K-3]